MSPLLHRKLLIWTTIPTHHQSAFFAALRERGFDVVVHYYKRVGENRLRLGWSAPSALPPGERYVKPHLHSIGECPDWHERVHIVPGYGAPFLLQLATWLSFNGRKWLHWSEPSRHSYRSLLTYPLKRYYGWLVDRYSLGALAIGELARRDFQRWGIDAAKIHFLPYAIAGLRAPRVSRATAASDAPRFLYLGQLCPRKGIDVLLRAFRRVLNEFPQARLDLVGDDRSEGQYVWLAETLSLGDAALFSDSVAAADIADVIAQCDVVILPSRHDGWGMALNEGASAGKALIGTEACGSAHHLIIPGRNGFRVASGNERALARAMLEYCKQPELRHTHGAESRKVFADFTPEKNAERLVDALEFLTPLPSPHRARVSIP